jgi:hypothetical protein
MRQAFILGYLGAALLMLASALLQGGEACLMSEPCTQQVVAPHCCCCGPACTCCEVSSPPVTPTPTDGKAPGLQAASDVSSGAGFVLIATPAGGAPAAAIDRFWAPAERAVYLLTRHFRN